MPIKAILTLDHVQVRQTTHTLFQNLSFNINQGENWALVGESGSGKSALLQTITGHLPISAGKIIYHFYEEVKQQHTGDASFTAQKLMAMVASKHHFRNLSNTKDFYYQQRYNSSDSEDAPTVESYLHKINLNAIENPIWTYEKTINELKLEPLLDKQLIKLSNGETKRLLIAAALLKHPALLLLDNPLTGLDVQARAAFNQLLTAITESGITVVMATSPHEIPDAITHVAILHQQKIEKTVLKEAFKPDEIKQQQVPVDLDELKALLHLTPNASFSSIISMENVNIRYGDKQVLNNINWKVLPGERWALLGPNGAGKSTLLSLVNGDNPQAYANHIILFDRKRGTGESIWDIKKKIGFVSPELHQYFPAESFCLQVIESGFYDTLGLFRPSNPQKAAIALRWMKLLQIENIAQTLLKNVTASTQRLCLLARALVKNPPLLIFDEPCQGLDEQQQNHFKHLLELICENSNTTLIYVTHYQQEIPDVVTKVLRLEKGNVADG
ncbi:ATP-binding cassette domain-containing protein [Mucilaginibacter arboris]|uniref:ATP-binding cassette domain-containing protein n=1 Tax=Mucilaginibacter arboris TaxID=2682090 RepID=A0A7K1SXU8_9SPHI|nr:ATP-binding cassette domain-containing protein [Mucilaginibacter arboris]MVN22149.1 ATP-binding cassette domain-containing protein [Mucilaginibacter arboris]